MTDRVDPLEDHEPPSLADQLRPYRKYGDDELAVALLGFQRRFQVAVPSIGSDHATFAARCQPAEVGAEFVCDDCEKPVRSVAIPGAGVCRCRLCGETPGMATLGRGVGGDLDD